MVDLKINILLDFGYIPENTNISLDTHLGNQKREKEELHGLHEETREIEDMQWFIFKI